jgi:hypothetical protein
MRKDDKGAAFVLTKIKRGNDEQVHLCAAGADSATAVVIPILLYKPTGLCGSCSSHDRCDADNAGRNRVSVSSGLDDGHAAHSRKNAAEQRATR